MTDYVIFVDPTGLEWRKDIEREIHEQIQDLDSSAAIEYRDQDSMPALNKNDYVVGLFLGGPGMPDPLRDPSKNASEKLLRRKDKIIPLVDDLTRFSSYIPSQPRELREFNGYRVDPPNWSALAVLVLEALGYLRSKRKIFISYVRRESRAVALQLYTALSEYWYHAFLDTHDILPGVQFQPELKHRLTDCDMLVLLDTPEVETRRFVMDEIKLANQISLGGVRVIWPDTRPWPIGKHGTDAAALFSPVYLDDTNFQLVDPNERSNETLTPSAIDQVILAIEQDRAATQKQREIKLVEPVKREAPGVTVSLERKEGHVARYINYRNRRGITHRIDTVIGHPDSVSMQRCLDAQRKPSSSSALLLYDPTDIAAHWVDHLEFLEKRLAVRLLSSTSVGDWLGGL